KRITLLNVCMTSPARQRRPFPACQNEGYRAIIGSSTRFSNVELYWSAALVGDLIVGPGITPCPAALTGQFGGDPILPADMCQPVSDLDDHGRCAVAHDWRRLAWGQGDAVSAEPGVLYLGLSLQAGRAVGRQVFLGQAIVGYRDDAEQPRTLVGSPVGIVLGNIVRIAGQPAVGRTAAGADEVVQDRRVVGVLLGRITRIDLDV